MDEGDHFFMERQKLFSECHNVSMWYSIIGSKRRMRHMWYFKYLKNLLCIRVIAELFVLRVLLETQVYGLIFLDIMILIAEQIRAIKAADRDYSFEREREIQELLKDEKFSEERYEELYEILTI